MKHSRGDWKVENQVIRSEDGYAVAYIPIGENDRRPAQDEANAALIRTAPGLLVACEGALTTLLLPDGYVDKELCIAFLKEQLRLARNEGEVIALVS